MADVKGLLSDPDFQKLSVANQKSALGRIDKQFSGLSDSAFLEFKQKMTPAVEPSFGRRMYETGVGMAKGLGHTLFGISEMVPSFEPRKEREEFAERLGKELQPTTPSQQAGYGAEQMLEYFAPLGIESKFAKAPRLVRAGVDALRTGLTVKAQTGSTKEALEQGGLAGGISGIVNVLAGPLVTKAGRDIQVSSIKPSQSVWGTGFKPETLTKLGLKVTDNLGRALEKVQDRLAGLRSQRNAILAPGAATVDLKPIFADVLQEVEAEARGLKHGVEGQAAIDTIKQWEKQIYGSEEEFQGLRPGNSVVDIKDAENFKESFGPMGSWLEGQHPSDLILREKLANKMYDRMSDAINQAVGSQGPDVQRLNREMHELIPVKNALLARIPVEERNRIMSLSDLAGLATLLSGHAGAGAILEAVTKGQKSIRLGNLLNRPGSVPAWGSRLGRGVGAIGSLENQQ